VIIACFHTLGTQPSLIEKLISTEIMTHNSPAHSLNTQYGILSDPVLVLRTRDKTVAIKSGE